MRKTIHSLKMNISILVCTVISIFLLSGCTQQNNPPGNNTVSIDNLAFNPSTLTIATGITVTWINNDAVAHTVTENEGFFDSGVLTNGHNFTYTFTVPGTYNYTCSLHPTMRGTIIVQ